MTCTNTSFVDTVFRTEFEPFLSDPKRNRLPSFKKALSILESRINEEGHNDFNIVETGTIRHLQNWAGGRSTLLFDKFVEFYGGKFTSIDIDPVNVNFAKKHIKSKNTEIILSDSVSKLFDLSNKMQTIDLLYLDSYDVKWDNPHPSAMHHMKELVVAFKMLQGGSIVLIDDSPSSRGGGKGKYARDLFDNLSISPLVDDYQILYQIPYN